MYRAVAVARHLRLLNGLAMEACPALFPCNICSASQPLGRGSRHLLAKSHARWLEQRRKELSFRDSAASLAAAAAKEISETEVVNVLTRERTCIHETFSPEQFMHGWKTQTMKDPVEGIGSCKSHRTWASKVYTTLIVSKPRETP